MSLVVNVYWVVCACDLFKSVWIGLSVHITWSSQSGWDRVVYMYNWQLLISLVLSVYCRRIPVHLNNRLKTTLMETFAAAQVNMVLRLLESFCFTSCNNPSVEQSNNDCSATVRLQTNSGCNENICKNLKSIGYWGKSKFTYFIWHAMTRNSLCYSYRKWDFLVILTLI